MAHGVGLERRQPQLERGDGVAHRHQRGFAGVQGVQQVVEHAARRRVVGVQDHSATLEIPEWCEPPYLGALLIPSEPIPIPLVRASAPLTQCDPPSGKVTGRIVEVKDRATPVGTDSVVFLDLGEEDGLYPGDLLTVYRARNDSGTIRTLLGEAAVLWTKGKTCVAKITSMVDSMRAGDFVELK